MRRLTDQEKWALARNRASAMKKSGRVFGCSICHRSCAGFGNGAWPINDGQCCDDCNASEVIPARIDLMQVEMVADASKKGGA
jgi:hypothetical protein